MKLIETNTDHIFLYVFASSKEAHLYKLQMQSLAGREPSSTEHDVVIAEVFENGQGYIGSQELSGEMCRKLRQQYDILPGQFKVVLVGRDSAIKLCTQSCVSYEEVVMRIENISSETK